MGLNLISRFGSDYNNRGHSGLVIEDHVYDWLWVQTLPKLVYCILEQDVLSQDLDQIRRQPKQD